MELSRRRFMQATGVLAAGAALDLELPATFASAAAIKVSPYSGYSAVLIPSGTDLAMQCFGFNGSNLYICQDTDDNELRLTQYAGAGDTTYKHAKVPLDSHGGQIGVNGTTIWIGVGTEIVRGTFNAAAGTWTTNNTYGTTNLAANLRVNTDSSNLVVRDGSGAGRLYSQLIVETLGATASDNTGHVFTFPSTIGGDAVENIGHDVSGTVMTYAVQTETLKANRQFQVGSFNFSNGTTVARQTYTFNPPSGVSNVGYELEGLCIVGSAVVVGCNHGIATRTKTGNEDPRKSFSLYTV